MTFAGGLADGIGARLVWAPISIAGRRGRARRTTALASPLRLKLEGF